MGRLARHAAFALSALLGVVGCATTHHPTPHVLATTQPATRPVAAGKPLIDFTKGMAGFPIEGKLPLDSREHLLSELTGGYAARVDLPTSRPSVVITGKFPHMDSLLVDLSDGMVRTSYRPTSLKSVKKTTPLATVKYISYTACPLHYGDSSTNLKITASDAKLALIHGKGEKAVLVMTDVAQGEASFDVTLADLNQIVHVAADDNGGKAVFFVRHTHLAMSSDNPHSLAASMDIEGFWLLIPTAIRLSGRIDIDDNFNATLSHLSCVGTEVGGPLMAGFIDPALKKYEGRTLPLVAFPGDKLKLRDLHMAVDDSLRVNVVFGD